MTSSARKSRTRGPRVILSEKPVLDPGGGYELAGRCMTRQVGEARPPTSTAERPARPLSKPDEDAQQVAPPTVRSAQDVASAPSEYRVQRTAAHLAPQASHR